MRIPGVTIETGYSEIYDDIAALYNAVSRHENPDHVDIDGDYFRKSFAGLGIDPERDVVIAVSSRGDVIGMGHLRVRSVTPPTAYFSIFVHPTHRRHGIGSAILQRIDNMARERGATLLQCNVPSFSEPAVRFAQHHQFREVGRWFKMLHPDISSVSKPDIPPELRICEIEDRDAEEWANLQNTIFRGAFQYEEVTAETFLRRAQRPGFVRELCIFGRVEDRAVGYCVGWPFTPRGREDRKSVLIHGIGVLPEYRGRGYGKTLLQEVLHRAAQRGLKTSELVVNDKSEPAIRLYRKLGYVTRYWRIWFEKRLA